jgi:hypothetical protein
VPQGRDQRRYLAAQDVILGEQLRLVATDDGREHFDLCRQFVAGCTSDTQEADEFVIAAATGTFNEVADDRYG